MHFKFLQSIQFVTAIWLCCVVAGMASLAAYSSAPSPAAGPPRSWPLIPELPRHSLRPTLVMFVHPRCFCSRASINELARVAPRCRQQMDLTVLFVVPPGCPPDWYKGTLWEGANSIPGVQVLVDHGGMLALEFHVTTSGHCLVYDIHEKLVFSGGITTGRGHEGDSPGQTIIAGLASQPPIDELHRCATYGCPLTDARAASR